MRQQFASVCAAYGSKLLAQAAHAVAKSCKNELFASVCGACGSKLQVYAALAVAICQRMRRLRQQFATVDGAYASKLLAYAPHTVALCQRRRRMRQLKQRGILGERKEIITASKMLVNSYSTLLHLPPLTFYCVVGCWDRTQAFGIDSQTLYPLSQISSTWLGLIHWLDLIHKARSHPRGQISSTRLDLIHKAGSYPRGQISSTRIDLIHKARSHPRGQISSTRLDLIHEAIEQNRIEQNRIEYLFSLIHKTDITVIEDSLSNLGSARQPNIMPRNIYFQVTRWLEPPIKGAQV